MAKEGSEKTRTAKECLGWEWAVVWVGFTAQDTQMTKTDQQKEDRQGQLTLGTLWVSHFFEGFH